MRCEEEVDVFLQTCAPSNTHDRMLRAAFHCELPPVPQALAHVVSFHLLREFREMVILCTIKNVQ